MGRSGSGRERIEMEREELERISKMRTRLDDYPYRDFTASDIELLFKRIEEVLDCLYVIRNNVRDAAALVDQLD